MPGAPAAGFLRVHQQGLQQFEPLSRLLAPAMALGFQGLADRMVDDFVRVADARAPAP
jgi:ribosome-associated toxin RatA of RatAB toxin-antitoxin module